ncbi:DNA excision repair protein ERCC-6-like [Antedon mediterranea]|uniref:DNA excision repair protein ERCC-6-like n=1 Tax=Antedon mediterranea TaxID=105859 RepID=UPI003AF7611E
MSTENNSSARPTTSFMEPSFTTTGDVVDEEKGKDDNEAGPSKGKVNLFHVDSSQIKSVPKSEQAAELKELGLFSVYDQQELEQGIIQQVDSAINAEQEKQAKKQAEKELNSVLNEIRSTKAEINHMDKVIRTIVLPSGNNIGNKDAHRKRMSIKSQKELKNKQLKKLRSKHRFLLSTLSGSPDGFQDDSIQDADTDNDESFNILKSLLTDPKSSTCDKETEEERLIRLGEMTPFGTTLKPPEQTAPMTDFEKYMLEQAELASKRKHLHGRKKGVKRKGNKDQKVLKKRLKDALDECNIEKEKNKTEEGDNNIYPVSSEDEIVVMESNSSLTMERKQSKDMRPTYQSDSEISGVEFSDDDYNPEPDDWKSSDNEMYYLSETSVAKQKLKKPTLWMKYNKNKKHGSRKKQEKRSKINQKTVDDGNKESFYKRLRENKMARLKEKQARIENGESDSDPDEEDVEFDGGWQLPQRVWKKLYRYQQTGVKWLWELHQQECGGIVGDEMGLGKTIQIIAFLSGLKYSKLFNKSSSYKGLGPVLIISPATVMHQWLKEFHIWWPQFRVAILHDSGSYHGSKATLVQDIFQSHGVLITSYSGARLNQDYLLKYQWHYVILDEGHMIRNPNAEVTVVCKQFRTCHRLILSGSPVQNNLKELWSLIDFVFPGKLGTLPDFMQQFSIPITMGGYANATAVQVQTAYKCACVLRDTINPYLLRRMKNDVKKSMQLPPKNEQVLFCRLTQEQRATYEEYLKSKECQMILNRDYQVFPGLITLRKISNHPDLSTGGPRDPNVEDKSCDESYQYGYWKRSGKMIVIESLLKIWKEQNHKVLLFSQSKQMLDILEYFVRDKYKYMRMDGTTGISSRQPAINKFNEDPSIFLFLLTTRVGGIGVNLTGANRIIIFDPDWNPSTDSQARERAWRIGQNRQVTVYRLLTTGTIEEKIYHRQIFKQFLTNRVLKDPKQRRFFKSNDLFELFSLGSEDNIHGNETNALFAGTGANIKSRSPAKKSATESSPVKRESVLNRTFEKLQTTATTSKRSTTTNSGNVNIPTKKSEPSKEKEEENKQVNLSMTQLDSHTSSALPTNNTSIINSTLEPSQTNKDRPYEIKDDSKSNTTVSTFETEKVLADQDNTNVCSDKESSSKASASTTDEMKEWKAREKKKIEKLKKKLLKLQNESKKEKVLKKKNKKKKVKNACLEGKEIAHLSRHSIFKPQEDQMNSAKQDDYVLQKLFKKNGVQSAMKHDIIMESSNPDYVLVEQEAERVAKEAANALKKSRRRCMPAASGIPTWTGTLGLSGRIDKPRFGLKKNSKVAEVNGTASTANKQAAKPKFGSKKLFNGAMSGHTFTKKSSVNDALPSSSELLSTIKARNNITDDGQSNEKSDLLADLQTFISFQANCNGQATTSEILEKFQTRIPSKDSAVFRSLLREICDLVKTDGQAVWKLRPSFR